MTTFHEILSNIKENLARSVNKPWFFFTLCALAVIVATTQSSEASQTQPSLGRASQPEATSYGELELDDFSITLLTPGSLMSLDENPAVDNDDGFRVGITTSDNDVYDVSFNETFLSPLTDNAFEVTGPDGFPVGLFCDFDTERSNNSEPQFPDHKRPVDATCSTYDQDLVLKIEN